MSRWQPGQQRQRLTRDNPIDTYKSFNIWGSLYPYYTHLQANVNT
jgi:hypothetical protein